MQIKYEYNEIYIRLFVTLSSWTYLINKAKYYKKSILIKNYGHTYFCLLFFYC